jgi:hypothetical protein
LPRSPLQHHIAVSADRWPDQVQLSEIESGFTCTACGKRDAEVWASEIAALPIVTRDQAATIRALVTETKANEKLLLRYLGAEKVEDIRGFERAVAALKARAQRNNPPG